MKYNPELHHRRSIRLKNYDYSQVGVYFVTICTQNRECFFGNVVEQEMLLNDKGQMVRKWWAELVNKFRDIELDEFIIMPNHMHGIISIVGADLRVCPTDLRVCPDNNANSTNNPMEKGEHTGSPLHKIIQWFKTMTTGEYFKNIKVKQWAPVNKRLWQRNYYEHIIRNEKELTEIRQYILNNPLKWDLDNENPLNLR